jgi:hypothetical protein
MTFYKPLSNNLSPNARTRQSKKKKKEKCSDKQATPPAASLFFMDEAAKQQQQLLLEKAGSSFHSSLVASVDAAGNGSERAQPSQFGRFLAHHLATGSDRRRTHCFQGQEEAMSKDKRMIFFLSGYGGQ